MFDFIRSLTTQPKRHNLHDDDYALYRQHQMLAGRPVDARAMKPNTMQDAPNTPKSARRK